MSLGLVLLAPPVLAAEIFNGRQYWIGDPHAHSALSTDANSSDGGECDGCGSMDGYFEVARENGLDWVATVDHVNGERTADPTAWANFLGAALTADQAWTDLTVVPATEIWLTGDTPERFGHLSFFMFGDDTDLAGLQLSDVEPLGNDGTTLESCNDIWAWVDQFSEAHGTTLAVPHHPGVLIPSGWDWTCLDQPLAPVVEIYSEHGNSLGDGLDWDPPWSGVDEEGTVHNALDPDGYAWKLGFLAGTDEHDTRPGSVCDTDHWITSHPYGGGLTIAVTQPESELSRSMLHDAFVKRHTLATTGPMLPVDMTYWSASGRLGSFGDELELPAGEDLSVQLNVPAGYATLVTEVVLVGPDSRTTMSPSAVGLWTTVVPADSVEAWYYAAVKVDGPSWYMGGCADGGGDDAEWVWPSPAFVVEPEAVDEEPKETGDTGCGEDTGDSGDSAPTKDSGGDTSADAEPVEGDSAVVALAPRVGCGLGFETSVPGLLAALALVGRRRCQAPQGSTRPSQTR